MLDPNPERLVDAVDYLLRFVYPTHGPMPEPDIVLAEMALSLLAGYMQGFIGDLYGKLVEIRTWMTDHPGEWPTALLDRSDN